jgi:hypothetical protein
LAPASAQASATGWTSAARVSVHSAEASENTNAMLTSNATANATVV